MTKKELEEENKKLKLQIKELNIKVVNEIKYNREKDEILFQQNKMAAMGEMIGNIAHQWRQPLMELSSLNMLIQSKIEFTGSVSNEEILQTIEQSDKITNYMSNTIDDFRNFLKKDKEKIEFKISNQVSIAVNMISASYRQHNIKLEIIVQKNSCVYGLQNEYAQVLINILTNAKDALVLRKIKNPKVVLHINEIDKKSIVKIYDNAGGINIEPIEKIFEPFFTKEKINGTGIGLFMSKLIIENNMNGKLSVENYLEGTRFNIIIPLLSK